MAANLPDRRWLLCQCEGFHVTFQDVKDAGKAILNCLRGTALLVFAVLKSIFFTDFDLFKYIPICLAIALNGWTGYKTCTHTDAVYIVMCISSSLTAIWFFPDFCTVFARKALPLIARYPWWSHNGWYDIGNGEEWKERRFDFFRKHRLDSKYKLAGDTLLIMLEFASLILSGQGLRGMVKDGWASEKIDPELGHPKYLYKEILFSFVAIALDGMLLCIDMNFWYMDIRVIQEKNQDGNLDRIRDLTSSLEAMTGDLRL